MQRQTTHKLFIMDRILCRVSTLTKKTTCRSQLKMQMPFGVMGPRTVHSIYGMQPYFLFGSGTLIVIVPRVKRQPRVCGPRLLWIRSATECISFQIIHTHPESDCLPINRNRRVPFNHTLASRHIRKSISDSGERMSMFMSYN